MGVFGNVSAKELSKINHTFNFWKLAFDNGTDQTGYHDKKQSVVDMMSQTDDINRMKEIISAYNETSSMGSNCEIINGVTFFYDGVILTDSIMKELEDFSLLAEDETYSIYLDDGRLVIY